MNVWADSDLERVKQDIARLRENGWSWRKIAAQWYSGRVSGAYVRKIYEEGMVPSSNEKRIALGMRPVRVVRTNQYIYGSAEEYEAMLAARRPKYFAKLLKLLGWDKESPDE